MKYVFLCLALSLSTVVSAGELEDQALARLEEFFLRAHELRKCYHVIGRVAKVTSHEAQPAETKYSETLFRKVCVTGRNEQPEIGRAHV